MVNVSLCFISLLEFYFSPVFINISLCLWGEDGLNVFREVGRVLELRKDSSHAIDLNQLSQSQFPSLSLLHNSAAGTPLCNPFSHPFRKEKIPLISEILNNINPNLMYPLHFLLGMLLVFFYFLDSLPPTLLSFITLHDLQEDCSEANTLCYSRKHPSLCNNNCVTATWASYLLFWKM